MGLKLNKRTVVSVSFKPRGASARGHWAKRSKKVGAGKERKRLPLSPDILPNAPKWLRSFGAYTVTSNVLSFPTPLPCSYFFAPFCPMPSRAYPAWLEGNGNDCYAGYRTVTNTVNWGGGGGFPNTQSLIT